ncbi:uncharacterized protein LOC124261948 isoform X3 [Haliotis rubra]|uniref:uncharacterized protein LOC124261948 isoform X3 n=1 Tax=Haliotis rubra TaxID=36100 RepID=UPI001EE5023E|nr:uncharacterized protein LOC124261948 isoform X3 [Haliotis rubra]
MEENRVVQDLVHGHRHAWIGLHRRYGPFQWNEDSRLQVKYVNWLGASRRYLKKCARIRGYDGFWVPSYCSDDSPYVCWKKTDCEPGWTGDDCNSQCHCYLGFACNGTESCPYGCELGWAGHKCDRRLDKPTVSFYCMKEKEGYSLVVSFDTKGVHFTNIGAVNAEGEVSPKCDKKTFVWLDGELRLKVQIQNTSGVWESDCPTETISKGVLKWTFRLQKKTDVVSFEDEDLQVHCDLSEADVAYDDTDRLPIENIRVRSLTSATKTRVNVRTYLANPRSLEPVTNVSLGVPVRLVVKLPEGNDVVNPLFYPWSCQAASPDGKVTVRLTDDLGCSLREDIGFGIMDKVSDVVQSEVFPLFQLPGYTEVVFTCNLVPSYKFRNETQVITVNSSHKPVHNSDTAAIPNPAICWPLTSLITKPLCSN